MSVKVVSKLLDNSADILATSVNFTFSTQEEKPSCQEEQFEKNIISYDILILESKSMENQKCNQTDYQYN